MIKPMIVMAAALWPTLGAGAPNDWMDGLDGNQPISQLSIPGTHDSGALHEPFPGTARCQDLTIGQQLDAGVRFLDIRCRHFNDAFTIHHGSVYQNMNFTDVLNATIGFLNANPSETVIMSVKEEHTPSGNTRSFEATFDAYVSQNPGKWLLTSGIPNLDDARGKIVLFRRFGASGTPKGIDASNWPDDTTFSTNGTLRVQDRYNVSNNDAKWSAIEAILNEARSAGPKPLYVNFASGVRSILGVPNIPTVSNNINPRLVNYFNANPRGRFGVVVMDFADASKCQQIYSTNFPDSSGSRGLPAFYMIVNRNSGKALDLISGNTGNGAVINQWSYDYGGPNQRWGLAPTENPNHFRIVSWVSGKVACMELDSTAPGAQLHAWDDVGGNPSQRFELVNAGDGFFKFRNVHSNLVLEVAHSGTGNNDKVQQNVDTGGSHQQWRLQPWGDYFIRGTTGKYICVQHSGSSNGDRIVQYSWENNPWFKWRFEGVGSADLRASSLNALSRVISVVGGSTSAGAACELWDYSPANPGEQKLRISPRPNGRAKLYFVHSGMAWDIPGGQTGNHVPLEQYPDNGNAWQEFILERVP